MSVKVDIWEEKDSVSSPNYIVPCKDLVRCFPDDDVIKKLGDVLIKGLVAVKVYGTDETTFELRRIKVKKLLPLVDNRNISSGMFDILFLITEMPKEYSVFTNKHPKKDEKGIEFYEWRFGKDDKNPEKVISMSFYPYNFPFLFKYMRIPQKRILINWNSIIVD